MKVEIKKSEFEPFVLNIKIEDKEEAIALLTIANRHSDVFPEISEAITEELTKQSLKLN